MPRSTAKTVLFARAKVGGKMVQNPIAVFPNDMSCRAFAVQILTAHRAGDATGLKERNVAWLIGEDGSIAGDLKFSRHELPYDPQFVSPDADVFADDKPAAS